MRAIQVFVPERANRASRIAPFEFSCFYVTGYPSSILGSISGRLYLANGDPRSPGAQGLPGRPPRLIAIPAEQDLLKGLAEDLVEDGVEDRVDHGAGVAEPGDQVEDLAVDPVLAVGTHGRHQVQHEERRPQDHEGEEHHAQHLGRLLLQSDDPAVAGAVARHDAAVARVMATHLAARVPEQVRRRWIALLQGEARRPRRAIMRPHRRRASQRRRPRGSGQ